MKRTILYLFALSLLITALFGCENVPKPPESGRLSVVATNFAPYDFARQIAGDMVDIAMLLPPGAESHSYEPSPQDMMKMQNCGVFIYVGGESDAWVDNILSADSRNLKTVTLMDCVVPLAEEHADGVPHGHEDLRDELQDVLHGGLHEGHAEYDEHVWTSPQNAKLITQKICDTLCEADARNAAAYRENAAEYMEKLDELDTALSEAVDGAARKTLIFGDRFPFRYFAERYGLEHYAAFPGCAADTEPSAQTIAFLIDKVKEERIPVVFHIELSNEKIADTICEATGAKKMLLHSCHNISKSDFENGAGYLDLMTKNAEVLAEALR